jgi:molybdate transport system regulatory protein
MKFALSARNQFEGTVSAVKEGAVNGIVTIDVNGTPVTATISMSAIRELGLKEGAAAIAVIKATEVMVGKGKLALSARNQFPGKVLSVEKGAVNGIVKMEVLGGNTITATISLSAIEELGLTEGAEATAVVKATSVMVGIPE